MYRPGAREPVQSGNLLSTPPLFDEVAGLDVFRLLLKALGYV